MNGLQAWAKQLILIVFLAGVAEMLLPQSGMRKYAQTALGLLVLLTILVPFLGFLRQDVNWGAAFAVEPAGADRRAVAEGVRRLDEVGRRLTLDVYREQVARQVVAVAEGVAGVGRAAARVRVDEAPRSPRFGTVTGVEVVLSAVDPGGGAEATVVQPVAPVKIGRTAAGGSFPPAAVRESVAVALAREFGLSRRQIQVRVAAAGEIVPQGGAGRGSDDRLEVERGGGN